jgi:ABC-type antimicrobial peptide transport system permease subunit
MNSLYRFILILIVIFCGSALGVWIGLYHALHKTVLF